MKITGQNPNRPVLLSTRPSDCPTFKPTNNKASWRSYTYIDFSFVYLFPFFLYEFVNLIYDFLSLYSSPFLNFDFFLNIWRFFSSLPSIREEVSMNNYFLTCLSWLLALATSAKARETRRHSAPSPPAQLEK